MNYTVITTTADRAILARSFSFERYGCIINNRQSVKMRKDSFVKSCIQRREQMSIGKGTATSNKYKNNLANICVSCPIRKKIDAGKDFKPPPGMEFYSVKEWNQLVGKTFIRNKEKRACLQ